MLDAGSANESNILAGGNQNGILYKKIGTIANTSENKAPFEYRYEVLVKGRIFVSRHANVVENSTELIRVKREDDLNCKTEDNEYAKLKLNDETKTRNEDNENIVDENADNKERENVGNFIPRRSRREGIPI